MNKSFFIGIAFIVLSTLTGWSQESVNYPVDTFLIKGQASAWGLYNPDNTHPFIFGGRYIPQVNYEVQPASGHLLDMEASANFYGNSLYNKIDQQYNLYLKPYRLWGRYSTYQLELRAGLQKINFGSASMLRPLMWFDRIDPRDPLQLTDGVWGLLGRYYFLNNANIWVWLLYGNRATKGWESFNTYEHSPEFGGRIQTPVPSGEAAFSYHHRYINKYQLGQSVLDKKIEEHRFGFDVKLDLTVGWWLEASWSHKNKDLGLMTNQEIMNIGLDYTFAIGNGLYLVYEHLVAANNREAFAFDKHIQFSLINLSYPIGLFDNLTAIVYYDWTNKAVYNFINWQRQFNRISIFAMGYINPRKYQIPMQEYTENLFSGTGVQLMLVYNH